MRTNEHVFIVGLPRTGSTLLRTLLNRSDRVSIAAETHFLHQFARLGKQKRLLRFGDLHEVVDHYDDHFHLQLTDREKSDLIAYLQSI